MFWSAEFIVVIVIPDTEETDEGVYMLLIVKDTAVEAARAAVVEPHY